MRLLRWIALALVLALGMSMAALAEEADAVVSGAVEAEAAPADALGTGSAGLTVEGDTPVLPEAEEPVEAAPVDEASAVSAPGEALWYARVAGGAPLYLEPATGEALAELADGEVVLVTGQSDMWCAVAFNAGRGVMEGFMDAAGLAPMDAAAVAGYQDMAAASGSVALYANDLNWPLAPLTGTSVAGAFSVMATNYTDYGKDTVFTINGKEISADMVEDVGNCWRWCQNMYKLLWGCQFNELFKGKAATGFNLLRELSDEERKLTPDHLKRFVMHTQPGATIRVCGCTSACAQFENDGLACGHKGHSLIIADKRDDGVITMDTFSGTQHTRFYSWQGFCNAWKGYTYIKYIKWPNAPALSPENAIDGYAVTDYSDTLRVRATAKAGASVYAKPSGKVIETLMWPKTFTAAHKAVKTVDGLTWVYGATDTGVTGWLPLTDAVAGSGERIAVTGVALDRAYVLLLEGASVTASAVIEPADASETGVSWQSSDPAVAAVKGGTIAGVSSGTATITATTKDGAKQASCQVKVMPVQGAMAIKKAGGNGTVKLCPGQKLQLSPTFATQNKWKISGVSFSKSGVADIDRTGLLTAVAEGKTTLTVKTANGKKATLNIQVIDPMKPSKVTLSRSGTVRMKKGGTLSLSARLSPVTAVSNLTWKSTNSKVAEVDGAGNVIAKKAGTCYIGAVTENNKYATVKIKVN